MASSTLATLLVKLGYDGNEFDSGMSSLQTRVMGVASALGGAVIFRKTAGYLKDAAQAAADEEQQMRVLQKAIVTNTGASWEQAAAVEDWIGVTQRATNVADGDIRPALTRLVSTTGDLGEAQDLLSVAIDIASARGLSHETVALALEKAYNGQVSGLQRLGINTKNAAGETLSFEEVMKEAIKVYGGSAAEAANTAAGKFQKFKNEMGDLKENIGAALIPIMGTLVGFIDKLVSAFNDLGPTGQKVVTILLTIVGGMGALGMVLGPIVAVIPAFGAVLGVLLGPIGLVVAGIAAVVAIVMVCIKYHEEIKAALIAAWEAIKAALSAAWNAIKGAAEATWNAIKGFFSAIWDGITGAFSAAWDGIKAGLSAAWNGIKAAGEATWGAITGFFSAVWDKVSAAFSAVWDAIKSFLTTCWNTIKAVASAIWDAIKFYFTAWFDIVRGLFTGNFGQFGEIASAAWNKIKAVGEQVWNAIKGFLSGIWDSIKAAFQGMWDAMKSAWDTAAAWIRSIPDKIKGFFSGAARWLFDIGKSILTGLLDGLKAAWDKVAGFFSGIGSKIKSLKGPIDKDRVLLVAEGVAIMEGFQRGLETAWPGVEKTLRSMSAAIPASIGARVDVGAVAIGGGGAVAAAAGGRGPTTITIESIVINGGREEAEEAVSVLTTRLAALGVS